MNNFIISPLTEKDIQKSLEWLAEIKHFSVTPAHKNVFPEPCPVTHSGCCSTLVGSCLAVGFGKDIDYLFYCPMARHDAFTAQLKNDGWQKESHEYISSDFTSWRKDKFNLIVTNDFDWYKKFEKAAKLCKDLALENKEDRILVHEAFLGKEKEEDEEVPF